MNMFTYIAKRSITLGLVAALVACGGAESAAEKESCGGKTIVAGLNYNGNVKVATVGVPVTFRSFVTPATCEGEMVFGITAGSLPPGLGIQANGNIAGTPTVAGAYSATVVIVRINGYQDFPLLTAPRTTIFIDVTR